MQHSFVFADPRGAIVASVLFGAMAVFVGIAVAVILGRIAAPADEPSYYGTTPRPRRVIGAVVAVGLLAIFWYQFWGGFYGLTMTGSDIDLTYYGPTRHHSIQATGLQVSWVPAGKLQQALQLTTADGTTYTSKATNLSRDERAAIESILTGPRR
jgi:hypothetical protein